MAPLQFSKLGSFSGSLLNKGAVEFWGPKKEPGLGRIGFTMQFPSASKG